MHLVQDENGKSLAHAHGDDHSHCHEHSHDCSSCGGDCSKETVALLTYMLQHNEHHAAELEQMAENLKNSVWMMRQSRFQKAFRSFRRAICG